ncbi:lipase [Russula dissimulans]|nr:lipase [Russula dissimulans]
MLSYILVFAIVELASAAAIIKRQSTTTLPQEQVDSFTPYTFYAAAAYCSPSQTLSWSCLGFCEGNPTFQPYDAGGDASLIPYWYVGWDSMLSSVVVAHQGTDPKRFLSIINDIEFIPENLNSTLFPGLPSSIRVHNGFAKTHERTAQTIFNDVQTLLNQHNASSVVLTGHSLGATIALLDAVYLSLHLPSSTQLRVVGYGMPRVGNGAFADYVDTMFGDNGDLTRINNMEDLIPTLPPRDWGFVHPSGEVHIQDSGAWIACSAQPGQENTSKLCTDGDVGLFHQSISNHLGPYNDGIYMGSC